MPIFLRQSTASQEVPLGYFVDSTDGNTEETALTIANTDIKVWKTGATTLASKNSGGATHISNGVYYAVFDATDTDTIGPLVIFVHVSGALTVRVECVVLDEAVYDVIFGTTALSTYAGGAVASVTGAVGSVTGAVGSVTGNVGGNVTGSVGSVASGGITAASIAADAITAAKIADGAIDRATFAADTGLQTVRSGTAQAGTLTTIRLDAGASAVNDFYNGSVIVVTGGAGVGLVRVIADYDGASKDVTFDRTIPTGGTTADNTSTFAIISVSQAAKLSTAIESVAASVTGNVSGNVTGSVGSIANGGIAAASFAPGAIDSTAIAADAIGSSELAASAVTEIQSGLATASALTTAQADLDDIQTRLPAALVSGRIDASVGAVATGAITAGAIAADAIGASELAADAVAEIADAVWDETMADHLTSGTTGAGLNAAGAAGDPWSTSLPGAYGAGTAGKIVGDNLDATVSSRSSHSAADVWASATRSLTDKAGFALSSAGVQAIWDALTSALTTVGSIGKLLVDNINATISSRLASASYTAPLDAAGTRTAVGLASANLDTQLSTIDDFLDTEITAIKAKTDNLPASPAATGDIPSAATIATQVRTELATELGRVDAAVSTRATPAQVNSEVLDVLTVDTFAEPAAVPAATSTLKDKLGWLQILGRNKVTQTATTQTVRNDADSADVATATVSDDGSTFTRDGWQ